MPTRRDVRIAVLSLSLATAGTSGPINAQSAPATTAPQSGRAQRLVFEVASVKPSPSPAQLVQNAVRGPNGEFMLTPAGIRTFPGGRLTATVVTLRTLIARAYGVRDFQIEGGPGWMGDEYFSIDARAAGDATPAQFNEMLESLLADRFKLEARGSTRPGKMHTLVLARSDGRLGPGLTRTPPECVREIEQRSAARAAAAAAGSPTPAASSASSASQASDRTKLGCGDMRMVGSGGLDTTLGVSAALISSLAERLAAEERAPVVDRTGLEGLFDYVVEFESVRPAFPGIGFGGLNANSTASPKPPLRIAIQDQLGLRLEPAEGQVSIVVIDAAEKPAPD